MNLPPHTLTHTHNHTHTYLYLLLCLTLGVLPSEGTFLGPSNPDGVRNLIFLLNNIIVFLFLSE